MNENLSLPGNPRYQPAELVPIFGYDNLYRPWGEIELAKMEVMKEIGMIPLNVWQTLTDEQRTSILCIKTSTTDDVERKITKHDVNAHVRLMKEFLNPALARFVHMPLTSYDKIDTGRVLTFRRAFFEVIAPKIETLIEELAELTKTFSGELQIGRTHGQHALPITVGFWFATLLYRLTYNYLEMKRFALGLRGGISGAVGAHNAQIALGFEKIGDEKTFEKKVLEKLGLEPAMISTQILLPEPIAYFLFSAVMTSASLGQLGRDGRNLMRTEVGELAEGFIGTQVGSSTMAHKRNPINFENTEGMWFKNKNEFGKVLDTLISEHQRDLVNSSVMRDFPIILVNLMYQLNTLLRTTKDDETKTSFIKKVKFDKEKLQENFETNSHLIMAEPIYISLQMAGYTGDAHHLVNHILVPRAQESGLYLVEILIKEAEKNEELATILESIPSEIFEMFWHPEKYTGKAKEKALEVADWAIKSIH